MEVSRSGRRYSRSDSRSFEQYIEDEMLLDSADIAAEKMYVSWQLEQARLALKISKADLANAVGTSRAQIDRVLDRHNQNVTVATLKRVAFALGKKITINIS